MNKKLIGICSTVLGLVSLTIIGQQIAIKRAANAICTMIDGMKDEEASESLKTFYETTKINLDKTELHLSKGSRKYYVEPRKKLAEIKAKLIAGGFDVK